MRAFIRVLLFVLFSGFLLFYSAGTTKWLMAWVYIMLLSAAVGATATILSRKDPELLAERCEIRKGSKKWDIILSGIMTAFGPFVILAVCGLNVRYGWVPEVSSGFHIAGVVLMIAGFYILILAMCFNTFFSPVIRIQSERGHNVAMEGPYGLVRHPGYVGAITYFLSIPLLLGSFWAFIPCVATVGVTILRLLLEESVLVDELPGYREYKFKVRYRLLPGIW